MGLCLFRDIGVLWLLLQVFIFDLLFLVVILLAHSSACRNWLHPQFLIREQERTVMLLENALAVTIVPLSLETGLWVRQEQ